MSILANPRYELFAQHAAAGKSAFDAAILAGYSRSTALGQTKRLSENVGIRSRIVEIQSEIVDKSSWTAARLLTRLGDQAEADLLEISDDNGNFKPIAEWPPHWRKMIQGLEVERKSVRSHDGVQAGDSKSWDKTDDVIIKIKFIDRLKNLELIGRHKAVDAFVQQQKGAELHLHLHAEIESRLTRAREIAATRVEHD